jgi:hypothetical protein
MKAPAMVAPASKPVLELEAVAPAPTIMLHEEPASHRLPFATKLRCADAHNYESRRPTNGLLNLRRKLR